MRFHSALAILSVIVMLCGCGNPNRLLDQTDRRIVGGSKLHANASTPNSGTVPSRPSRPLRGTAMMSLWAKDIRINTLVSNHGIGTAGEPGIAALPDGSAGMFIAWEDSGLGAIRTQRLDSAGNPLWSGSEVSPNAAYQASPLAVADGSGGWLVAWIDGRNGGCDSIIEMGCSLYIQRLDAAGARRWGDDAFEVAAQARFPAANRVAMISDSAGGAYLAWSSSQSYYHCCSFYMQHIGPDGQALWAANGIRVTELPATKEGPAVTGARLVADGGGGVIIAWWNQQSDDGSTKLMAQRIDPSGNLLWGDGGVQVAFPGAGHANFDAASDGAGGIVVAIQSNDLPKSSNTHLYLQRVSSDGQVLWGSGGVQASPDVGAQVTPSLLADRFGGAFVTWALWDTKSILNNRIFVQHVDPSGSLTWSQQAAATESSVGQTNPHLLVDSDGGDGVIVAWEDCRSVTTNDIDCIAAYDIYAQHIDGSGQRAWDPEGLPISAGKANQGVDYGAEKRPGFEMVSDDSGGVFFVWPDGRLQRGCQVGMLDSCELYAQHLAP